MSSVCKTTMKLRNLDKHVSHRVVPSLVPYRVPGYPISYPGIRQTPEYFWVPTEYYKWQVHGYPLTVHAITWQVAGVIMT